jgi:hypothetical protein
MNVSACIATRGDVDLDPIYDSFPDDWEVVAWDNSGPEVRIFRPYEPGRLLGSPERNAFFDPIPVSDLGPYGRFAAIAYASREIIYVQDDDVVVSDPEEIVWESDSGGSEYGRLVCNMPPEFRPHYPDSAMVGFGAAFHRDLPEKAFSRFFAHHTGMTRDDPLFLRESCRVFTGLTPRVLVDVAKTDLPYASDPNRLWKQPVHVACRERMLHLVRQVP